MDAKDKMAAKLSDIALPEISDEDKAFISDNPNTDDLVEWIQNYALNAIVTLINANAAQAEQLAAAHAAMQEFVDRCDAGEARSNYTYSKFKGLLQSSAPTEPQAGAELTAPEIIGFVNPQDEDDKENCCFSCCFTPGHGIEDGWMLGVVNVKQYREFIEHALNQRQAVKAESNTVTKSS